MSKSIAPTALAAAIQKELTNYNTEVVERVNAAGEKAAKKLKKLTKANAPVASGSFKRNITVEEETTATGCKKFKWGVKAPDHWLTHLLVHGHATRNGGRTKGDPFLQNALDIVLPEYEQKVEEALKG